MLNVGDKVFLYWSGYGSYEDYLLPAVVERVTATTATVFREKYGRIIVNRKTLKVKGASRGDQFSVREYSSESFCAYMRQERQGKLKKFANFLLLLKGADVDLWYTKLETFLGNEQAGHK